MVATFIAAKGTYCAGASTLVLLGGRLTRCHGHISRAPLRCVGFPVAVLVQAKGERRKANVAAAFGARRGRGSRAEAAGFFDGLIVDNFAGGGGASLGLELGLGRAVDIAVNHDAAAIAMHSANHPRTLHLCEDVWAVDPVEVCAGRAVDVAWFSPDCKHFSRAKGGKPVEKKIRGLAWVAVKWARLVRPRVIFLENVREFADWGPLGVDSRPCRERKGRTFRRFVSSLRNMGMGCRRYAAKEFVMSNREPQLGDLVKESVTGLTGVVVCISTSLNGCRQVCVVPRELKDGKPIDGQWYDDARVDVIEAAAVKVSPRFAEKNGGPATNPMPRAN